MEQFLSRYSNPASRKSTASRMAAMLRHIGTTDLSSVTEERLHDWITSGDAANNTVRQRLSTARTFFKWCVRKGLIESSPAEHLDHLTHQYADVDPHQYSDEQSDGHPDHYAQQ